MKVPKYRQSFSECENCATNGSFQIDYRMADLECMSTSSAVKFVTTLKPPALFASTQLCT